MDTEQRDKEAECTFKKTVLWTIYILGLFVILLTVLCVVVDMIAPTFFPNSNITGFLKYLDTFCIILSFLSVGLGFFSIWQANEGSKQINGLLKEMKTISEDQHLSKELMQVIAMAIDNGTTQKSSKYKDSEWKPDNNIN